MNRDQQFDRPLNENEKAYLKKYDEELRANADEIEKEYAHLLAHPEERVSFASVLKELGIKIDSEDA